MRRYTLAGLIGGLLLLGAIAPTNALFHLAVIDEVLTSYNGDPSAQFIEVRMLGGSQNFVAHSVFAAFDASGAYSGDILEVPANVTNSGAGVRWLVGTSSFQTASGVAPDFVMPAGVLPSGGGMVCFGGGGGIAPSNPPTWSRTNFANYVDCVAYGTYAGSTNAHIGMPTARDGDGHSLQRTSSTNDNATDFTCGDPITPQNNAGASASLPATTPCFVVADCPASPDLGCATVIKGAFSSKETAGKEKLSAKLTGGPALAQIDFGNPLAGGGTDYQLCVYSGAGALVGQLDVDRAGDTCGTKPCWNATGGAPPSGKGYNYKDKALAADGVSKLMVKGGVAGKSKAQLKGKGANLPDGIAAALQSATSATIQLRGSDATQCLSATLSTIVKHDPDYFKAK
ncbi:MAG: hypothetical protein ABI629_10910 [bacterium]